MTEMEYRPIPVPARLGQGTAVEQSRAAAQVMAAVQIARQFPRDEVQAITAMRQACRNHRLAKRAFYSFPRAGGRVTGPTIHMARELARCWGNIDCGIVEMIRDDEFGQSEMLAYAWDLQTNERISTTFIVPHTRDTKDGAVRLTDARDVYERNANDAARRLREMIFAVLPWWFREEAVELCEETLTNRGQKELTIQQKRGEIVDRYEQKGIGRELLEQRIGRPADGWILSHIADLNVLYDEICSGKIAVNEVFGAPPVTDEELKAPRKPSGTAQSWGAVQYGKPAENPAVPDEQADGWPEVRQPGSER